MFSQIWSVEVILGKAISSRNDYEGDQLRSLAKTSNNGHQVRILFALSVIYDGGFRTSAARMGGVSLQILRDWVLRFNAEGPEGLIDRKSPGAPPKLSNEQRVNEGPELSVDGVVRWRLKDLEHWLCEEFDIVVSEGTVSRELQKPGVTLLTVRPRHVHQDKQALEDFKKISMIRSHGFAQNSPPGTALETRWQDDARVGQKTKTTRRWCPGVLISMQN